MLDLSITLRQINPNKSFKEIDAEIDRVNQKVGGTLRFADLNGYFAIVIDEGNIPANNSEENIYSMMELMIEAAKEDIVQAAIAVYGESEY